MNRRGETETAGKEDHRTIANQPGWWLGLTPGLKNLLRERLKEHGYVEHGTRTAELLDIRGRWLPEPDMEPAQSMPC